MAMELISHGYRGFHANCGGDVAMAAPPGGKPAPTCEWCGAQVSAAAIIDKREECWSCPECGGPTDEGPDGKGVLCEECKAKAPVNDADFDGMNAEQLRFTVQFLSSYTKGVLTSVYQGDADRAGRTANEQLRRCLTDARKIGATA